MARVFVELLKQGQYEPLPVEKQIVIIYAGTNGFVDELPVDGAKKIRAGTLFFRRIETSRTFSPTFSRSANWTAISAPS